MICFGSLRLINFGPFEDVELDLANRGLVAILGDNKDTTAADSNGSGKSHLLKGLTWVLHGVTVEGDRGDKVIRHGQKAVSASQTWTDNGTWVLTRTKIRGSAGTLVLTHDGQDVSGATMALTQAEVNRRLGIDYPTWRNTVMYAQGDLTRFADPTTTDTDRKAILKRILRLDVFDKAAEAAKGGVTAGAVLGLWLVRIAALRARR